MKINLILLILLAGCTKADYRAGLDCCWNDTQQAHWGTCYTYEIEVPREHCELKDARMKKRAQENYDLFYKQDLER